MLASRTAQKWSQDAGRRDARPIHVNFRRGVDAEIAFSRLRSAQWRKRHNTKLPNIGSPRGSCKTACRLNFGLALDGAIRNWRPKIFQIKSQFLHLGRPKSGTKTQKGALQGPSAVNFLARPRCRNFNFWVEERAMAQTLEYISAQSSAPARQPEDCALS